MSAVEEFTEVEFIISHGIDTYENLKIQNAKRKSIVMKLQLGKVTKEELMNILDEELCLLVACGTAMKNEIKELENTDSILSRNNRIFMCMLTNINKLFNTMFKKFPICYNLLSKYLDFCLKHNMFVSKCKRTLNELVFNYHSDYRVYALATTYVFEELCDIQKARQYFDEGFKFHHKCKQLYLDKFSMEVKYMEQTGIHSQGIIEKYYRQIKILFQGDMEFHFSLIFILLQMHHFIDLHYEIFMDIYQEYKCNPYMWQFMANINVLGYIFNFETISLSYSSQKMCRIMGLIDTYTQGPRQQLSAKNQQHLWILYVDHLMDIHKSRYMNDEETNKLLQTTLKNLFQDAHVNNTLYCISYYLDWVRHTNNIDELMRSFDIIEEKLIFWKKTFINCMENDNDFKMINDAYFYCAPSALDSRFSLKYIIQIYMQHQNDPDMLNVLKKQKYNSSPDLILGNVIKTSKYLELCDVVYAGIDEVIKFTYHLKSQYSKFNILYNDTKTFKKNFNNFKIDTILKFSELICIDFGYNNISLWIDYIEFVYEYCRNEGVLVNTIFQTASKYINPNLCFELAYKFNKLQKHYVNNTCISLIDD